MPGPMQLRRIGMRRIADTNILVRYLTGDDEKAAKEATAIIHDGVEALAESIPETLYVLTSKMLYAVPQAVAAEAVGTLLDDISIEKKDTVRLALKIYGETKLDYVDCRLIAEGLVPGTEIVSLDKKLFNELQRRTESL